ncbi:MAG: hypothetical protein K2H90_04620 [Oscillospiraceae bacterium]|nr:hypothetical protein [Oscillospiraceae bacterium]
MLKMTEGCHAPKADALSEQYEILENKIIANVNADKLRKNDSAPRHIDVTTLTVWIKNPRCCYFRSTAAYL